MNLDAQHINRWSLQELKGIFVKIGPEISMYFPLFHHLLEKGKFLKKNRSPYRFGQHNFGSRWQSHKMAKVGGGGGRGAIHTTGVQPGQPTGEF